MYGQFEQVVDRFNWPVATAERRAAFSIHRSQQLRHSPIHRRRRRHRRYSPSPNCGRSKMNTIGSSTTSFASDSESDSEMEVPKMMGLARQGVYGSRSGSKGLNPLLDTISVIGDLCDSDDAVDGPASGALYAGSNSVDSGYKSSCPTPDCLILAQDASNYISARPPPVLPKPRRTLPAAPALVGSTSGSHPEGSNHCTAPLDLDHLTSLRQTLLTAIERYDTRTKELIDRDLPSSSGGGAKSSSPAESDHQFGDSVGNTDDDYHSSDRGLSKTELKEDKIQQQDGATRFSRVAHCMLEIIEDLQRQQQQQQQQHSIESVDAVTDLEVVPAPSSSSVVGSSGPVVPPKPTRISLSVATTTPAPATPPRVARRGRRKLPTPTQVPMIPPSPPSSVDSGDLTGADYHLYEEIIYDLGSSKTSIGSNLALNSNEKNESNCCPPPLPARPSRPPNPTTVGSCLSSSVKPWLNVIKPLRRDRNNQLIRNNTTNSCSSLSSSCSSSSHWTSQMANKLNSHHTDIARSNVYTFGSHPQHPQSHPPVNHPPVIKPQAFHPAAPAPNSSSLHRSSAHHHLHEDEYGFRAVSHMV
ncbi:uncharacterized protein LOC124333877 isoform X2 [Daphnia pulicaria]|nr:uncharacterized protein LOC124333877 isoform X2 [Daphnia pulicaria]